MLRIHRCEGDRLVARTRHCTQDMLGPAPARAPSGSTSSILRREEDACVERMLGISLPSREEMQEIEVSARLYNEGGAEFMTITAIAMLDTDEPVMTPHHLRAERRQLGDGPLCGAEGVPQCCSTSAAAKRRGLRDRRAGDAEPDRGPDRPDGGRTRARCGRNRRRSRAACSAKAQATGAPARVAILRPRSTDRQQRRTPDQAAREPGQHQPTADAIIRPSRPTASGRKRRSGRASSRCTATPPR